MIVLVTGGRAYDDRRAIYYALSSMKPRPTMVVQGGAPGADSIAKEWAHVNDIHHATIPALWESRGKAAGPDRNSAMLMLNIEYCVAFPGNTGTADMVRKSEAAGIPIWKPYG